VRRPDEGGEIENLVGPLGTPTNVSKIWAVILVSGPGRWFAEAAMFDDEMMRSGNGSALVRKVKRV
jgi:hypothetical protein